MNFELSVGGTALSLYCITFAYCVFCSVSLFILGVVIELSIIILEFYRCRFVTFGGSGGIHCPPVGGRAHKLVMMQQREGMIEHCEAKVCERERRVTAPPPSFTSLQVYVLHSVVS